MHIKRIFVLPLILMLLAASCLADEANLPVFEWERDGVNHWQLDASGAVINQGAHDSNDGEWICSVCGSEVIDWGDGSCSVTNYDAYGNTLRYSSYENGELTYDSVHALVCNEEGIVTKDEEYVNGVLYGRSFYVVDAEGMQLPAGSTFWNDDGTTSVNEYDMFGNCVRAVVYEADGSISVEIKSDFEMGDDGWFFECSTETVFASGDRFYNEMNMYGDTVRSIYSTADVVWKDSRYEYKYADGMKLWCGQYESGGLVFESFYDEDEGLVVKEIEYLEDGGTVVCLYNEQTDMISATTYAADGTVVTETTYECFYDEDMNLEEVRTYIDGVLQEE